MVKGLGGRRIARLLDRFHTPEAVWNASLDDLLSIPRFPEKVARALIRFDDWNGVDRVFEQASRQGIQWVSLSDDSYPMRLAEIHDPPPLLWALGDLSLLQRPMVAIVGTRRAARYSMDLAREWGEELARFGYVVVSGMAEGVDHAAHQGALRAGKSVAVPGCGVDRLYPVTSRDVYNQMVEGEGAVVSPFLPGSNPERGNFPARNRIISGLSLGVLLVQSGVKGGGMLTARMALDQNREVFALPHDLYRHLTKGGHQLIQSGEAKLVTEPSELTSELPPIEKPDGGWTNANTAARSWKRDQLSEMEQQVLDKLSMDEWSLDRLGRELGLPPHTLASLLAGLELDGWVRSIPGGRIALVGG